VAPLVELGADIHGTDGRPPIVGRGGGLRAADIAVPVASAQVAGAVLFAALNAAGVTTLDLPGLVRDHTERLLLAFGVPLTVDGLRRRVSGPATRLHFDGPLDIPGDLSSAAFLLAAAALVSGSLVTAIDVGLNPGRIGFLRLLGALGADITVAPAGTAEVANSRITATGWSEPRGDVRVASGTLRGAAIEPRDVPAAIDELPLLAVVSTQATGTTRVTGAAELRVKETDRIAAIADGLRRLGADIDALPDGFRVRGPTALRGAVVDGRGDHRIVMALAVAGLVATGETVISDAAAVADSFPGFVDAVNALATKPLLSIPA
jgi:3-phosphoshikimate 1-carboxyvinyltransferase